MPSSAAHDVLRLNSRVGSHPTVYVPLLFAPFLNTAHASIATSFCETLQIVVRVRDRKHWLIAVSGVTDISGLKMDLRVDSTSLDHKVYKSTIDRSFKPGGSAQILLEDCMLLAESTVVDPVTANMTTVNKVLTSSCTSVVRSFMVVAISEQNLTGVLSLDGTTAAVCTNEYAVISNVEFQASGRTIFNQSRSTADMFRSLKNDRSSGGIGNAFLIIYAMNPGDPSFYSRSCPTAGLSSQRFTISIRTKSVLHYRIRVYAIGCTVKSVLSDPGSVISALST